MHFCDFFKFFGNPSKFRFWGVSSFFLLDLPKLYIHFRFILIKYFREISQYVWGDSQYFWYVSSFFFYPFPLFSKLLNWSVSSYFRLVSSMRHICITNCPCGIFLLVSSTLMFLDLLSYHDEKFNLPTTLYYLITGKFKLRIYVLIPVLDVLPHPH